MAHYYKLFENFGRSQNTTLFQSYTELLKSTIYIIKLTISQNDCNQRNVQQI